MAIVGAVAGGLVGHFVFLWITQQGFYALVLPGGLAGMVAGYFRPKAVAVAVVCGIWGLVLGVFSEWRFAPFIKDASLGYFLSHLGQLRGITMIMIAAGAAIGFWVPFRRRDMSA